MVQKELMKNRIIYLSCKTVVHVLEKSVAHILRRIGKKWPQLRNIYNNVCRMFYMRSMDRMKVKVTQSFLGFFSAKWRGQDGLHTLYCILWISMKLKLHVIIHQTLNYETETAFNFRVLKIVLITPFQVIN